jgi:hypothetical protein
MKMILSAAVLALATSALPALVLARTSNISVPSAQNSGAGIPGDRGDESGPTVRQGTVGSAAGRHINVLIRLQDPAKIAGLPGTESGPPVKPPSRSA